ncbi:hypothetical protein ACSW8Z_00965 [Clostridium perfringens]|nr:hypothetical protein [Clostridium perfringens]HEE9817683.1 hypothetical protein [Clostridium perfringens]HEO1700795.1 hypothetical protein [Clostridium perfringens]
MILLPEQRLWEDIEKYCRILDDLVVLKLEPEQDFSVSKESYLSKLKYEEKKQEIEKRILELFDKVNDVDKLSIALFIFRSVMKEKMYEDSLNEWTLRFKICNYLFFLSLKYLKNSKRTLYVNVNERQVLKTIFFLGYTFFENQCLFNEQQFPDSKDSIDKFFNIIEQISNRNGDLHSYQIKNSDLKSYLNMKSLNIDIIRNNALSKYKEQYLSKSELLSNISWRNMIERDNISHNKDDIIIIPIHAFNKYDKQLQSFITNFEAEKCRIPSDTETELIFSYKTDKYFYISKRLLYYTQTIIEDCIIWGQYENLTKYFFGLPVNQKTLSAYNRLMTYKIADLLLANGYIIPMETVKRLSIPRIEISNYLIEKKLKNKLGDIDLIFYSEYTKILYLIEYKNYQMMISRDGDLKAEVSKVNRENTPEKVNERHKYVCSNIEHCIDVLFKNTCHVEDIKSIILTTKPCYYFYMNKSENYEYMEWVEFESKVLEKKL